jgi:hypothetical protein
MTDNQVDSRLNVKTNCWENWDRHQSKNNLAEDIQNLNN